MKLWMFAILYLGVIILLLSGIIHETSIRGFSQRTILIGSVSILMILLGLDLSFKVKELERNE